MRSQWWWNLMLILAVFPKKSVRSQSLLGPTKILSIHSGLYT